MATSYNRDGFRLRINARLLENVTTAITGDWIYIAGFYPISVQVSGLTKGQVDICVSNSKDQPASNDDGTIVTSFTANGLAHQGLPPCDWVKAVVRRYTSGTITVDLVGIIEQ